MKWDKLSRGGGLYAQTFKCEGTDYRFLISRLRSNKMFYVKVQIFEGKKPMTEKKMPELGYWVTAEEAARATEKHVAYRFSGKTLIIEREE